MRVEDRRFFVNQDEAQIGDLVRAVYPEGEVEFYMIVNAGDGKVNAVNLRIGSRWSEPKDSAAEVVRSMWNGGADGKQLEVIKRDKVKIVLEDF